MAKSDIILKDDHVVVEGELKVDTISSYDSNRKPVTIESALGVRTSQILIRQGANNPVQITPTSIRMRELSSSSNSVSLTRQGNLSLGGNGRISAKRLSLSDSAYVKKINSSQITLGGSSNDEGASPIVAGDGRISLLNAAGKEVLTIGVRAGIGGIFVPGIGDIINELKELQKKVAILERRIR